MNSCGVALRGLVIAGAALGSVVAASSVAQGACCPWDGRPCVESEDGVTRLNTYAEGYAVCQAGQAKVCQAGDWKADVLGAPSCEGRPDTPARKPLKPGGFQSPLGAAGLSSDGLTNFPPPGGDALGSKDPSFGVTGDTLPPAPVAAAPPTVPPPDPPAIRPSRPPAPAPDDVDPGDSGPSVGDMIGTIGGAFLNGRGRGRGTVPPSPSYRAPAAGSGNMCGAIAQSIAEYQRSLREVEATRRGGFVKDTEEPIRVLRQAISAYQEEYRRRGCG